VTKSEVKESRQRRHRIIGRYLAIQAWLRGFDCIVLTREHLKTFLDRENIWEEHIKAFTTDINPWFRDHKLYRLNNANRPVHSLFLFRLKRNAEINREAETAKTGRFSKFDDAREIPSQADMVLCLEGIASGLKVRTPKPTQK
jgi:hypothetical protein